MACVTATAMLAPAMAADLDDPRFTLRGFGTAAATHHDADGIEFRRHVGQARALPADEVGFYTDSLAGVQLNARITPQFDVVLQAVSRQDAEGDWTPEVSQGFVRYSPDDSLVLRAGRIGYDLYLLAESRQVGYSYLAVRPSTEVYALITNDEIDGADVSVTRRLGHGLFRARAFGGINDGDLAFADGTHSDVDGRILGVLFDYVRGGWTTRIAFARFRFDADPQIGQLAAVLRMTGMPQATAIADDLDRDVYESLGMQLGVAFEDGPFEAQLLAGGIDSDSLAGPDVRSLHAQVGYRLHSWTPFVSFARSQDRNPVRSAGLPPLPMFAPIEGAVRTIQERTRSSQRTTSIGVRYDLSSHVDFKLQLDRVTLHDTALVFDRRAQPGDARMTVITLGMDFVF